MRVLTAAAVALSLATAASSSAYAEYVYRHYAHGAKPSVPAQSCAAETVSWNSCSANIGAAAHGQSSSATNAAAGFTGTANFTCSNGSWQYSSGTCEAAALACGSMQTGYRVKGVSAKSLGVLYAPMSSTQCLSWCNDHLSSSLSTACFFHDLAGGRNDTCVLYAGGNIVKEAAVDGQYSTASCN